MICFAQQVEGAFARSRWTRGEPGAERDGLLARQSAHSDRILPVTLRYASLLAVLIITGQSQACTPLDAKVSQPSEFAGRWVRLVSDTLWSDTVELVADGHVRGWKVATVPDSTHWAVVESRYGHALCVGPRGQPGCQTFRLEGDTLVLGRVPKQSYWRRAR